jgi:uncharacterized protein YggU (UPF0235/DUF167 family)
MGLFGQSSRPDPKKAVTEMSGKLRRETRAMDRQIQTIEREQNKTKMEIKKAAKAGNRDVCKILAKELVNSKKAVSKLHQSKAQMNSVMVSQFSDIHHKILSYSRASTEFSFGNIDYETSWNILAEFFI